MVLKKWGVPFLITGNVEILTNLFLRTKKNWRKRKKSISNHQKLTSIENYQTKIQNEKETQESWPKHLELPSPKRFMLILKKLIELRNWAKLSSNLLGKKLVCIVCQNIGVEGKLGPGNVTEPQTNSKNESERPCLIETEVQFWIILIFDWFKVI